MRKYLGQRWDGLLFTADQKYDRVGLGEGPSLGRTGIEQIGPLRKLVYWGLLVIEQNIVFAWNRPGNLGLFR